MSANPPPNPVEVLFLRNIRGLELPSGAEIYLANLARFLPRNGVNPHFLFSVDPRRDHTRCLDLFRDVQASFDVCPVGRATSRQDLTAAKAMMQARQPDILHTMDHRSDVLGAIMHRAATHPVVATFQGWTNFRPGSFRWTVYGALDRLALARLDLVFFDSYQMIENLGQTARSPHLRYVANGIDVDRFQPVASDDLADRKFTFVQIARFHPNKGQMDFVRAAQVANEKRKGLRFVLVGASAPEDAGYERDLRAYVDQNNLTCVEFAGTVPHAHLPGIIADADVLVAPSYVDGVSLAVLEAMAMQRAVICYNAGGLGEAFAHDDTALVVETGDVEAMAQSMVRLATECGVARRIGHSARRLVESRYSIQAMAAKVAEGYREVLFGSAKTASYNAAPKTLA